MMRQNSGMKHIGIGHYNMPGRANQAAGGLGSVAVESIGLDIDIELIDQAGQFRQLILRKRFGREKIKCAGRFVFDDRSRTGRL